MNAQQIDPKALAVVIAKMKTYRPYLTREQITQAIQRQLNSHTEPKSETMQDLWWAYKRALEDL